MSGWSFNLQATETVRRHALDEADRRQLLEMVGLVEPGGRVLTPDDHASYHDVVRSAFKHTADGGPVKGRHPGDFPLQRDPEPPAPAPEPAAPAPPAPRPTKDGRAYPGTANCPCDDTATARHYDWHTRQKKKDPTHQACQPSKTAASIRARKYAKPKPAARPVTDPTPAPPAAPAAVLPADLSDYLTARRRSTDRHVRALAAAATATAAALTDLLDALTRAQVTTTTPREER